MHDETFAELFTDRTQLAVARTMPVPFAGAIAAAVGLARPPFPLYRRWERADTGLFDRSDLAPAQTCGYLKTGRRTVPVDMELTPWSRGITELVLRPNVRAPHRWSGRRRRMWYAAAHAAADALRQQLVDAQPSTQRGAPTQEVFAVRRRLAG
jgi:hypothetical protein